MYTDIVCPELQGPLNGDVSASSLIFNNTAEYTCHEGFMVVGSDTRQCQVDGTWSGTAPTCQSKTQYD